MKRNKILYSQKTKLFVFSLLIATMAIGCGVLEFGLEAANQPTVTQESNELIPTPDPFTDQQTSENETEISTNLNQSGPWLVFITGDMNKPVQIWAANPDGSGMTVLADNAFIGGIRGNYLIPQISPNGQAIAYIEVQEEPIKVYLHIVDIPSGDNRKIVMLYDGTTLGYSQEILDVILYQASSLAWSPDGRKLAFIGAMEGGTADLYLHVPEENSVTRLSDGPTQAYMPVWSEDGKTILHTATSQFHQGEGFSPYMFTPDGLWSLDTDTYNITSVPWPFGSEPAFIKYTTWHDSTFIFLGTGSPCEDLNGCWINILSEETGSFPFQIVKYAVSPESGGFLATSFQTTLPINTAGAYLFTPANPQGIRLFDTELDNIHWLEQAGAFAAQVVSQPHLQALQISSDGIILKSKQWQGSSQYMRMMTSPDGSMTAWYRFIDEFETGLWLTNDETEPLRQVFSDPVHDTIWSPDSQRIFFIVDEFNAVPRDYTQGLYMADREGQDARNLFSMPPENFITILGFAGQE